MPRTRKQPAKVSATPQVLITREQYIEDIKVRWQIHTTEVNHLVDDIKKVWETALPYVITVSDYVAGKYQQLRTVK